MSIRILQSPYLPHDVRDDVESVFWNLLFVALRWFRHKHGTATYNLFDSEDILSDPDPSHPPQIIGGGAKLVFLAQGTASKLNFHSAPLNDLVEQLAKDLRYLYFLEPYSLESPEEHLNALRRCSVENVIQQFNTALGSMGWPGEPERVEQEQHTKQQQRAELRAAHQKTAAFFGNWVASEDGELLIPVNLPEHNTPGPQSAEDSSAAPWGGNASLVLGSSRSSMPAPPPSSGPQPTASRAPPPQLYSDEVNDKASPFSSTSDVRRRRTGSRISSEETQHMSPSARNLRRKRNMGDESEPEASTSSTKKRRKKT